MAILNDILKKLDGEQATAPASTPPAATTTPQTATPEQPAAQPKAQSASVPAADTPPAAATQIEPKYPNEWGYSDAEMEHLSKNGFTDDKLKAIRGGFNPANYGTPGGSWFEKTMAKPTAPDEKKIRTARIIASIGDALGSIVQMAAAGGGALVKPRKYEETALGQTDAKAKDIRNVYQQQRTRYDEGIYNARMRDVINGIDQYNKDRAEMNDVLTEKARSSQRQAQFEATLQRLRDKDAQDKENETRKTAGTAGYNAARANAYNALAEQRRGSLANDTALTAAKIEELKNGKGETTGYQIVLTPNAGDTEGVFLDSFDEPLKVVNISQAEADKLIIDGSKDAEFLRTQPQFAQTNADGTPNTLSAVQRKDLAAAYYQYLYGKDKANRNMEELIANQAAGLGYEYNPAYARQNDEIDPNDPDNRFL